MRRVISSSKVALVVAASTLLAPVAWGAVATFQNGTTDPFTANPYAGTQDDALYGPNIGYSNDTWANSNWGGNVDMRAGLSIGHSIQQRAILKFDLSSVPAGTTIQSASLTLAVSHANIPSSGWVDYQVDVYQIADADAAWQQGTAVFANQNGSACWNYLAYDPTTPTPWAGGAGLVSGTDYVAAPVYTTPFLASDSGGLKTYTLPASLVQHWLTNPNAGLLITATETVSNDDQMVMQSSESGTISDRPLLTIKYTPVPEPMTGSLVLLGGGLLMLRKRHS